MGCSNSYQRFLPIEGEWPRLLRLTNPAALGLLCMAIHDRFGQLQVESKDSLRLAAPALQNAAPEVPPEFAFKGQKVRVALLEGAPWFVAVDVCSTLDMSVVAGVGQWTRNLALDEKRIINRKQHPDLVSWGGRTSHLTLLPESGLYKLIMRSDKPQAKAFQDWVTREVLPSISKALCLSQTAQVKAAQNMSSIHVQDYRVPEYSTA